MGIHTPAAANQIDLQCSGNDRTKGDGTKLGSVDGVEQTWQNSDNNRIAASGASCIAVMEQQDVAPVQLA